MGLITKEVEIIISNKNIKHYRDLGYKIIKKSWYSSSDIIKVKVEHLTDGSHVKVDIKCDGCEKEIKNIAWKDYKKYVHKDEKYYCHKCANKIYGNGVQSRFKEEEIRRIVDEKLGNEWVIHEIKIIKCHTNVKLEDREGYLYDNINVSSVKFKDKPRKFHKSNPYTEYNINHYCELNNLFIRLKKDNRSTKDIKHNKSEWYCLNCNNSFKRTFDAIRSGQISCPCCSDNVSYSEKFGLSLFNQLDINYNYNSKLIKPQNYRYDFIFSDLKIIIEMHGLQHYKESFSKIGGKTLEEEQENDRFKKELAESNNYKYIEIDCRKSELEWIKHSILNSELTKIFDLSKINWLKCHKYACSTNLVKETCDLWNSGIKNTLEISKIIKLSRSTITIYLKQGEKLGWCNYDPKEAMKESCKKSSKKRYKPIIQLSLDNEYIQEFNSIKQAKNQTGIKNISSYLSKKYNHAGGFKWMYKSDYEKLFN